MSVGRHFLIVVRVQGHFVVVDTHYALRRLLCWLSICHTHTTILGGGAICGLKALAGCSKGARGLPCCSEGQSALPGCNLARASVECVGASYPQTTPAAVSEYRVCDVSYTHLTLPTTHYV